MMPIRVVSILLYLVLSAHHAVAGRFALVIGNDSYQSVRPLENARNDANAIADVLQAKGFQVERLLDADHRTMRAAIDALVKRPKTWEDVSLLYFAGHGVNYRGKLLVLPVDFDFASEDSLLASAVALTDVLVGRPRVGVDGTPSMLIVIVDACRNNAFEHVQPGSRGAQALVGASLGFQKDDLASVGEDVLENLFLIASTQPGEVAYDGDTGNSPFTHALRDEIANANEDSISDTMIAVRNQVEHVTGGKQIAWDHSALRWQFRFTEQQLLPCTDDADCEEQEMLLRHGLKPDRLPRSARERNLTPSQP